MEQLDLSADFDDVYVETLDTMATKLKMFLLEKGFKRTKGFMESFGFLAETTRIEQNEITVQISNLRGKNLIPIREVIKKVRAEWEYPLVSANNFSAFRRLITEFGMVAMFTEYHINGDEVFFIDKQNTNGFKMKLPNFVAISLSQIIQVE
jgi:hypothetical protein